MFNDKPIGIFDSGLGGLTALRRLAQLLPREDVIYLGDTGRVPYGPRSRETIARYAREDARFLLSRGVKAIVAACNTVSSSAIGEVRAAAGDIPVFDVLSPPSRIAASLTRNGRIGVLGTAATIRSGAYEHELKRTDAALEVMQIPCPLFVPLVENGRTDADDIVAYTLASEYLAPLREFGADTVILGCTHYPLLRGVISRALGDGVTLVDSGAATAEFAAAELRKLGLLSDRDTPGARGYYVTDIPDGFAEQASRFLESDVSGEVKRAVLEEDR